MAEPREQGFLDDIEEAAAEEQAAMDQEDPRQETSSEAAEVEALKAERDALQNKFMRALADAENARKRSDRDRREAENYGSSKIARDMLPVHDSLKRALDTVTEEQRTAAPALVEGIELTLRELLHVFEKHNISLIDPQVGDKFDPQHHEAMFEAPVPGTRQGEIIQISAQGFKLHERILRPAQVGVSSNKE